MKRLLIVVVVCASLLGAYLLFGRVWLQERSVKQAIVSYDLALSEALLSADAGALEGVATAAQRSSVASYLGIFELKGTRLQADLVSIELLDLEVTETASIVTVQELWKYDTLAPDGLSTGERYVEASTLRYTLVRESGNLVVGDVEVLRTETEQRGVE